MNKETTIKVKTDTRDELMMMKIKTREKSLNDVIEKAILKFKRIRDNNPLNKKEEL